MDEFYNNDDDDSGEYDTAELMGWTTPKRKTCLVREVGDVFVQVLDVEDTTNDNTVEDKK